MDHNSPDKSKTSALAAQSAAAVRALRDRAQRALEEREQRLVELEERIAAQLAMIGEEIARDAENTPAGPSLAELEALTAQRSEFERERSDWETCRERQEAELITARQAVEVTSTELNSHHLMIAKPKSMRNKSSLQLISARLRTNVKVFNASAPSLKMRLSILSKNKNQRLNPTMKNSISSNSGLKANARAGSRSESS